MITVAIVRQFQYMVIVQSTLCTLSLGYTCPRQGAGIANAARVYLQTLQSAAITILKKMQIMAKQSEVYARDICFREFYFSLPPDLILWAESS